MKLGLGLSRQQLDLEHYRFARQCGCTHLVLHLTEGSRPPGHRLREASPTGGSAGWGASADLDDLWTYEALARLTEEANAAELQVGAVDQLGPMLPPKRQCRGTARKRWLDRLKATVRNVGHAGIPVLGYDLGSSEADRRRPGRFARGDAETFELGERPEQVRSGRGEPVVPPMSGLEECLRELLPVAEEAGVTLAAQVRQPDLHGNTVALDPGLHLALEFRVADVAVSMGDGVYSALAACLQQKQVAFLRAGNVRATPTHLYETFVDDGDIDIPRIVRALRLGGYEGMIVPGPTPRMTCAAPWHAAMAHTLGYLKAALQAPGTAS